VSDKKKYLIALVIPSAILLITFIQSQNLFEVSKVADEINSLPVTPVLLYERGNKKVFYTSEDLLHPEYFGKGGQYYEAVLFDIFPAHESKSIVLLRWSLQIKTALAMRDTSVRQMKDPLQDSIDIKVSEDFMKVFPDIPNVERGKVKSFILPPSSGYGVKTSIRGFIGLAIKEYRDSIFPSRMGSPQLGKESFNSAFKKIDSIGANGAGIPYMDITDKIGDLNSSSKTTSWTKLLDIVDGEIRKAKINNVVFGGFGIYKKNRQATDYAFRQAWLKWKFNLSSDRFVILFEEIRLTSLVAIVALLTSALKRRGFYFKRLISILVVSSILVILIAKIFNWFLPLLPELTPTVSLLTKAVLAIMIGIFMEQISGFKPKEIVAQNKNGD
jgi:hypothetical protein